MRELSPQEKNFIKKQLSVKETIKVVEEKDNFSISKVKKKKHVRFPLFRRPIFWAGAVLVIPVFLITSLVYQFNKIESVLGKGSLNLLSTNDISDALLQDMTANGLEFVPQLVTLYSYRNVIIFSTFGLFLLISLILIYIDYLRQRKIENE